MASSKDVFFQAVVKAKKENIQYIDLIVKINPDADKEKIRKELGLYDAKEVHFYEYTPHAAIKTSPENAERLAKILCREVNPLIINVELSSTFVISDFVCEPLPSSELARAYKKLYAPSPLQKNLEKILNDDEDEGPPGSTLWNLKNVAKYEAEENFGELGAGVKVAVVDTGCDYKHTEIRHRFNDHNLGYNFVDNNSDPMDDRSHGTHCAGIIAGINVGVATDVKLYAVKVLSGSGSGSEADVIKGIEWCIRNEMDVVSMSLGGAAYSEAFKNVCDYAQKMGVHIIAAAGNSYVGNNYPASFDSVVAVAAVDREKNHCEFSNKNTDLDVSAPGKKVLSCIPHQGYARYSGTSMACPHVAGVVAAAYSCFSPAKNGRNIETFTAVMKDSCDSCISSGSQFLDRCFYGAGHVNVNALINALFERMDEFE